MYRHKFAVFITLILITCKIVYAQLDERLRSFQTLMHQQNITVSVNPMTLLNNEVSNALKTTDYIQREMSPNGDKIIVFTGDEFNKERTYYLVVDIIKRNWNTISCPVDHGIILKVIFDLLDNNYLYVCVYSFNNGKHSYQIWHLRIDGTVRNLLFESDTPIQLVSNMHNTAELLIKRDENNGKTSYIKYSIKNKAITILDWFTLYNLSPDDKKLISYSLGGTRLLCYTIDDNKLINLFTFPAIVTVDNSGAITIKSYLYDNILNGYWLPNSNSYLMTLLNLDNTHDLWLSTISGQSFRLTEDFSIICYSTNGRFWLLYDELNLRYYIVRLEIIR